MDPSMTRSVQLLPVTLGGGLVLVLTGVGSGLHAQEAYQIRDTSSYENMVDRGILGVLYQAETYVDSIDLPFGLQHVPNGVLFLPVRTSIDDDPRFTETFRTEYILYDGGNRVPVSKLVPLFIDLMSSPAVVDSVLHYWGFRESTILQGSTTVYAMRYDFTEQRADSTELFDDPIALASDYRWRFGPPQSEDGVVMYDCYFGTFRLSRAFDVIEETLRGH